MSTRSRILWFGGAAAAVLAGVLVAAMTHGITGESVAISISSLGLIALVSLAFFEVGLSEDRERAAEAERRKQAERPPHTPRRRLRPRRRGY
jgi:membrane protein implicated in regulation of membrane protease activity